jgi:hypothetical protein
LRASVTPFASSAGMVVNFPLMSIKALTWAMSKPVRPATKKLLLIALADCAGGGSDDLAYPCIQTLTDKTSLNRKTVISMLEKLCADELLIDTGKRTGATKQIPVYRLPIWNSPKNGTVPILPPNSPENGFEQSRFYHGTVPKTGHVPVLRDPLPKESLLNGSILTATVIYDAYPLKVGKPNALKAIEKAMKNHDPKKLLALTLQYSSARGDDLTFVPHPATWFNQERFADDPKTWAPKNQPVAPPSRNADRNQLQEKIEIKRL